MALGSRVPRVSLMRVTVEPGTTAACGSQTLPDSLPVVNCAAAGEIPKTSANATVSGVKLYLCVIRPSFSRGHKSNRMNLRVGWVDYAPVHRRAEFLRE